MLNDPPISGQSASTKHSIPRTEGLPQSRVGLKHSRHQLDLLENAVDELGAVPPADQQCLDFLAEGCRLRPSKLRSPR